MACESPSCSPVWLRGLGPDFRLLCFALASHPVHQSAVTTAVLRIPRVSGAYERISFSCLRVNWVWLIQARLSAVSLAGLGFLIQVELSSAPCLSILVPRPRRQPLGKRWS